MKTGTKLQFVNKDNPEDSFSDFFLGGGFITSDNEEIVYRNDYKLVDKNKIGDNTFFINLKLNENVNFLTGDTFKKSDPIEYYINYKNIEDKLNKLVKNYTQVYYTLSLKFLTFFKTNSSWVVFKDMLNNNKIINVEFGTGNKNNFKMLTSYTVYTSNYIGNINTEAGHDNDCFKLNINLPKFKDNNTYTFKITAPNTPDGAIHVNDYYLNLDFNIESIDARYNPVLNTYNVESLKQNLECVLQTLKGELPYNESIGVPLKLNLDDTKLTIQNTILNTPGVQSIKFIDSYQERRHYYFNIEVKSNFGVFNINFEQ